MIKWLCSRYREVSSTDLGQNIVVEIGVLRDGEVAPAHYLVNDRGRHWAKAEVVLLGKSVSFFLLFFFLFLFVPFFFLFVLFFLFPFNFFLPLHFPFHFHFLFFFFYVFTFLLLFSFISLYSSFCISFSSSSSYLLWGSEFGY